MKRRRNTYAVTIPQHLHAAIEAHATRLGIPVRALVEAELAHLEHGEPRSKEFRLVPRGGARPVEEGTCSDSTGQGRRCRRPVLKGEKICGLHYALRKRLEARLAQHAPKPPPAVATPCDAPAEATASPAAPAPAPAKQRPPALNLRRPPPVLLSIADGRLAEDPQEAAPPRPAGSVLLERVGGVEYW